jgi:hypothetical protein
MTRKKRELQPTLLLKVPVIPLICQSRFVRFDCIAVQLLLLLVAVAVAIAVAGRFGATAGIGNGKSNVSMGFLHYTTVYYLVPLGSSDPVHFFGPNSLYEKTRIETIFHLLRNSFRSNSLGLWTTVLTQPLSARSILENQPPPERRLMGNMYRRIVDRCISRRPW